MDAVHTGNVLTATSGTSTSGQDSSGAESGGSARSFGTASEVRETSPEEDETTQTAAGRKAADLEREKKLFAEIKKTDRQLAADVEFIDNKLSGDEAKDLKQNSLAEAELAAK